MATYTSPQDGTQTHASMASGDPTGHYNLFEVGEWNGGTNTSRTIMKFPGLTDGTIPANANIVSATIYAKVLTDYSSNARTFRVFRMKRNVSLAQCTWNIYSTGNNWATAGGFNVADCEQTDIGSVSMAASEAPGTWKTISLTPSAVQEIVKGTWTTPALLIKADTETDDRYDFYQYNAATSTDRPYIVVVYLVGGVVAVYLSDYGVM